VPLMETIRGRRSIRRYRPDPVPREKLGAVM
jgi:nitroreductase